jgi:hypothetical protein
MVGAQGGAPFGPRQLFTNAARCGPVRFLASARLLQAFSEFCFLMGVAFAPLGVAVVVGRGASVARAELEPKRATMARATAILIRASGVRR